jgi:mesencephalic astrocyte-derived neurotrophic factor
MNFCAKLFFGVFLLGFFSASIALKEGDCEVCVKVLEKFGNSLDDATKKDPKKIETEFRKYCKTSKNKENRFVSSGNFIDDVFLERSSMQR